MAGVGDVGSALCEANVPFGLAKIHHVQEQLGIDPDATFVGAPDATITRNEARWSQGFGYGGVYAWSGDFTVLDIKPNACGMIVGSLPELPDLEDLRARLHALDDQVITVDGTTIENDLAESNHFVDVFKVVPPHHSRSSESSSRSDGSGPQGMVDFIANSARYLYIMHSSGHEHRGPNTRGPGLYWDQSAELRAAARRFETPWGDLRILDGERLETWYRHYLDVQHFNHRRREALADFLFGEHSVLINATHQGLVRGYNRANIGCYTFDDSAADDAVFPLTLSPNLPAFLVRGRHNIGEIAIEKLGWSERIERHALGRRIAGTNVLPHGGGYAYPQLRGVARVIELGPDDRRFELMPAAPDASREVIETPRHLDYSYRGLDVKNRLEELELGEVVARLDLEYVLTA